MNSGAAAKTSKMSPSSSVTEAIPTIRALKSSFETIIEANTTRRCWGRNPFPLSDYFMIFS